MLLMKLKDSGDDTAEVILLGGQRIVEGDGKLPPLDVQNLSLVEIRGEILSCQRGGHDDDPELA